MPNNGDITANSLQTPAVGSAMAQPVPTSPTGPPPPFPAPSSSAAPVVITPTPIPVRPSHNDLNDTISKIIQSSIHNGSGSTNTNHNNNNSSEKRLFGDDQLSLTLVKSNHKEDGVKSVDEKQHHRSRRKPKATNVTSSAQTAAAVVVVAKPNQQHKHTNGLNSNGEKILSNCINLLNGDDGYDEASIESWKEANSDLRKLVCTEIRRPGRDFRGLYQQLEKVKGTFEMRFSFIQMCIKEAYRFRRKNMASCIEEWWEQRCTESPGKNKS